MWFPPKGGYVTDPRLGLQLYVTDSPCALGWFESNEGVFRSWGGCLDPLLITS